MKWKEWIGFIVFWYLSIQSVVYFVEGNLYYTFLTIVMLFVNAKFIEFFVKERKEK